MAERETDGDSNSMEFNEEDERSENEWEEVVRGRRPMKVMSHSRKKKDAASSSGMESEGREGEEKNVKAGLLNVVVIFEGGRE